MALARTALARLNRIPVAAVFKSMSAGFGDALRCLRQQRGLSLSDLSCLVYYSKPYLSRVETGERNGTLQLALACDRVLEADGELALLLMSGPREADQAGPGRGLPIGDAMRR